MGIVLQTCKRPWACLCAIFNAQHPPSKILSNIAAVANRTMDDAARLGIRVPSPAGEIDEELNRRLQPPNPLRGRVNHEEEQKELRKKLINKISVFTALLQMRNRAGIQEENNLKVLGLVQQATERRVPVSLWDLFASQYELSFLQKLSAAFFYWFYYQTSLIDNTVSAYLNAFLDNFTAGLTEQNNQTRAKVFRAFIEEVNEFLGEDIKASRAYAYGEVPGSLAKIQDKAIEQVYGGLLSKLCEDFSYSQVMEASPEVKFLENLQDTPVIGRLVKALQWAINRYVIQSTMMYSILPQSLQAGVTNGLSMTHVDNLPFVISLTQFFNSQFADLLKKLDNEESSPCLENQSVPGTELLPPTIKLLLQALELEQPCTPLELRKKFEQFEKGGSGLLNIAQKMEKATTDSANMLFSYLNQSIQSGALITQLLDLSLKPFSGQIRTEARLRAEYREEQSKFFSTSEEVFRKLIRKALSPSNSIELEHKSKASLEVLKRQKIVTKYLIEEKIGALCDEIGRKIEASQGRVEPEYDIQKDLVSISQLMKILETRHEFQEPLDSIDSTHRDEIWARDNHLFAKLAALQTQMTKLHVASQAHLQQAATLRQLEALQTTLLSLPGHYPLSETLPTSMANAAQSISEASRQIHLEDTALDAIKALYFQPDAATAPTGLLVQLFESVQGISLFGVRRSNILRQIAEHLTHFSNEEKAALTALIGDGSQIASQWNRLSTMLYSSYRKHIERKEALQNGLQNDVRALQQWTEAQKETHSRKMRETYQSMRESTQTLGSLKTDLLSHALPSSLTTPLSRTILNSASAALPLAAHFGVGGGLTAIATGISAAALRWFNPATPPDETFTRSFLKKSAAVGSAALTTWFWPSLLPVTTAAFGWNLIDLGRQGTETHVFDQVWDKLTQAYNLTLNQRVYKAFFTRFLKRATN